MGARKRRAERYHAGDCSLGWRKGWAVADYRDAGTGKRQRIRLGRFKKNSQEARDALDRFAETRRAVEAHHKNYSVGEIWKLWLAERERDGFRNDIYQAQWVSLKPAFGNRMPHLLKTEEYRDYARDRFALGRSAWTVHNELVRLRTCLKWAADTHLIDKRPKVWVPTKGGHRDRVLTFDEARALVAASTQSDPHIHIFIIVAFATGARHTAILDLTWPRVDFVTGLIEFDENAPPDPMSRSWKKGRATVPMNRAVRAVLELAYKGRRSDHVIEHGGERLKTVRAGFAAAVKRAGIDESKGKVTPHVIRHTVITWLDQAQIPTGRTAQLAGHKNEEITKRVYTHASPEVLQEAVQRLNDALHQQQALTELALQPTSEGSKRRRKVRRLSRGDKSRDDAAPAPKA